MVGFLPKFRACFRIFSLFKLSRAEFLLSLLQKVSAKMLRLENPRFCREDDVYKTTEGFQDCATTTEDDNDVLTTMRGIQDFSAI